MVYTTISRSSVERLAISFPRFGIPAASILLETAGPILKNGGLFVFAHFNLLAFVFFVFFINTREKIIK